MSISQTVSTAKHATLPTHIRSSTGSPPKAAAGRITKECKRGKGHFCRNVRLRNELRCKMSRKLIGCIIAFILGIVAIIAMSVGMTAFVTSSSGEFSIIKALSIVTVIYLVLAIVAGLIGHKRSWFWGICVASPLLLTTLLSLLFAGPSP